MWGSARSRDSQRHVYRGLWLVFAGIAAQLLGIAGDALLHHGNPGLAAEEGPLSVGNPAHLAVFAGTALILVGAAWASIAAAAGSGRRLRGPFLVTGLMVLLSSTTGSIALATGSFVGGHEGHHEKGRVARVDREALLLAELKGVLTADGTRAALDRLERAVGRDEALRRRSHDVAHSLGRFVYARYRNVGSAFRSCDKRFVSGCYHGVLQEHFARAEAIDRHALAGFCKRVTGSRRSDMLTAECQHGLGHGLLAYTRDRPLVALRYCDGLPDQNGRQLCYAGVFMQRIVSRHGEHVGDAASSARPRARDLQFPCGSVAVRYRTVCHQVQPMAIVAENGGDVRAGFEICARQRRPYDSACARGMGEGISIRAGDNVGAARDQCLLARSAHRGPCLAGVVSHLVLNSWRADEALGLCGRVPAGLRLSCFEAVGSLVPRLRPSSEGHAQECAKARRPRWITACERGAAWRTRRNAIGGRPLGFRGRAAVNRPSA